MKKQQQRIENVLDSKKIAYEKVDIAASEDSKKKMRDLSGNPTALPPQLFNEDTYCGVSCSVLSVPCLMNTYSSASLYIYRKKTTTMD